MAIEVVPSTSAEWVGLVVTGLLGTAYYTRKFVTKFAEEAAATDRARAESDVVKVLREELRRLSDYNKELHEDLKTLRESVDDLNNEISSLRLENSKLKHRIEELLDCDCNKPTTYDDEGEPE